VLAWPCPRRIRASTEPGAVHLDVVETTLLVGSLAYAGTGWLNHGDALLATTAAVQARERALNNRDYADDESALPAFSTAA
jgi:hypothetical protein